MPDKVPVPVISLRLILILSWILCLGLVNSSYCHKWKFIPHTAAAAEIKLYAVVNKRSSLIMMIITRHAINLSACNICIQMQTHRITVTHLCVTFLECRLSGTEFCQTQPQSAKLLPTCNMQNACGKIREPMKIFYQHLKMNSAVNKIQNDGNKWIQHVWQMDRLPHLFIMLCMWVCEERFCLFIAYTKVLTPQRRTPYMV